MLLILKVFESINNIRNFKSQKHQISQLKLYNNSNRGYKALMGCGICWPSHYSY